jgi:Reverse transcriptase (RNA-dependent DNA polymerase)
MNRINGNSLGYLTTEPSSKHVAANLRVDEPDLSRVTHATCSAAGCKSAMNENKPNLFSQKNLARANKHVQTMLGRIKQAHSGEKTNLRYRLIVEYLRSMDARVVAVDEAYHALKPARRPAKKMLMSIAEAIRPYQSSDEPVIVNMKTKPNGSYRLVMDFDIQQRARQYLVASVLKRVADLHPDQYATRGGVPAAIDRVATLLMEGYEWTTETDIENCFPSFTGTSHEQFIPVKKQVIANVILAIHLNVTPGDSLLYQFGPGSAGNGDPGDPVALADALSNARQGIPQGSAVAPIAVEMFLAEPLKSLPTNARVVCYADNMFVMAKTKEDAASTTSALWSALQGHPVGHLKPKQKSQSIPGQPFEFLGHQITRMKSSVNIVPTPKNEAKFAGRFKKGLAAIANPACSKSDRNRIADDLRDYVSNWTPNFSRCAGMADRKKKCLIQIQKVLALAHEVGAKKNLSVGSQPATLSP